MIRVWIIINFSVCLILHIKILIVRMKPFIFWHLRFLISNFRCQCSWPSRARFKRGNAILSHPHKVAEEFAASIVEVSSTSLPPKFQTIRGAATWGTINFAGAKNELFNLTFIVKKIKTVLKSATDAAAGPHNYRSSFLCHTSENIVASSVQPTKNIQTFTIELSLLYKQKTTQLQHYFKHYKKTVKLALILPF